MRGRSAVRRWRTQLKPGPTGQRSNTRRLWAAFLCRSHLRLAHKVQPAPPSTMVGAQNCHAQAYKRGPTSEHRFLSVAPATIPLAALIPHHVQKLQSAEPALAGAEDHARVADQARGRATADQQVPAAFLGLADPEQAFREGLAEMAAAGDRDEVWSDRHS
jgi:hypothetical protein